MPIYETVYILKPDLSASQVTEANDNYIKLISKDLEDRAKVGRQEYWGLRNITFRMRKQRKGHYLLINYEGASAIVDEFERRMRLNEDVMRYMTIRLEVMPTKPSMMMKRLEEEKSGGGNYRSQNSYDKRKSDSHDKRKPDSFDKRKTDSFDKKKPDYQDKKKPDYQDKKKPDYQDKKKPDYKDKKKPTPTKAPAPDADAPKETS